MIDPIGVKPGTIHAGRPATDEVKVAPLKPVPASLPATIAETSAREAAKALAARPPVDVERVKLIKQALQDGRYPIVPAEIADRMIAAQLRWVEKR